MASSTVFVGHGWRASRDGGLLWSILAACVEDPRMMAVITFFRQHEGVEDFMVSFG